VAPDDHPVFGAVRDGARFERHEHGDPSQLGNVIMSSVAPTKSSEAGGLQGTARNLGSSLGTAIIGA
jgi:hypothetical protein